MHDGCDSILALVGGALGVVSLVKVNSLNKQVYLLRSDLKIDAGKHDHGGCSHGCGGNC